MTEKSSTTCETADIIPKGKPRRKRGGQPGNRNSSHHGAPRGNKNAAKHGFYSKWFTRDEHKRLDTDRLGQLDDEEFILNAMIDRIISTMGPKPWDPDKTIVAGRAVSLAVGRIESIHRSRKAVYENQTNLEKILDDLKYIPMDED
jgi:hypothetical protein